jgi:hypothetical protein
MTVEEDDLAAPVAGVVFVADAAPGAEECAGVTGMRRAVAGVLARLGTCEDRSYVFSIEVQTELFPLLPY